jgi:L-ascorbate metabolism protein UlaG (beta-lactamase superfamily)
MTTSSASLDRIRASPQFRDGRFHNTAGVGSELQGSSLPVMRDFFFGGRKRIPRIAIPVESPLAAWSSPPTSGLRITWLGHSTLLIEIDGVRVLTDPVFGPRASPFRFAGPKRFHRVPAKIAELPPLDVVLLSHDHHDHLDPSSIRALAKRRVPFVTSLGVAARLVRFGVDSQLITELDWWESHTLPGGSLTFTAAPAQHFSGRGLFDRNKTLWSSWVLASTKRRLFFSADTGLTDELREISQRLGPFEVSMIEIGAWHPAWGAIHLGPEGAMRAYDLLGGAERAGAFLPIHWGTFDLALHRWDEPIETLLSLTEPAGVRVLTPVLGAPIEPAVSDASQRWWRTAPPAARETSLPVMSVLMAAVIVATGMMSRELGLHTATARFRDVSGWLMVLAPALLHPAVWRRGRWVWSVFRDIGVGWLIALPALFLLTYRDYGPTMFGARSGDMTPARLLLGSLLAGVLFGVLGLGIGGLLRSAPRLFGRTAKPNG